MNLVGKIFTVLIFVMSILFMTMSLMVYATHKNWRTEATARKDELSKVQTENQNLTTEKETAKKELEDIKSAKQKELAAMENELSLLKDEIKKRETEQAKLTQTQREAVATMNVTQTEAKKLREEVEGLRAKEAQAQADRDNHLKEVQRLTDELHDRANELATLKERTRTLAQDLAKADETLRRAGLDKNIDYANMQPPNLDGFVKAVRSGGLVEISLGSDDGLRKGHKLEVYRVTPSGSSYVGRVEVTETTPDLSVCKTDSKFQQSDIKNGDSVTTKLTR